MTRLALLLALALASPAIAQDKWIASDKGAHLIMGTAIAGATTAVVEYQRWPVNPAWAGFAAGCTAGAAKELYDRAHPLTHTASWKDFTVSCLGAVLGATGMHWMLGRQAGVTTLSWSRGF